MRSYSCLKCDNRNIEVKLVSDLKDDMLICKCPCGHTWKELTCEALMVKGMTWRKKEWEV